MSRFVKKTLCLFILSGIAICGIIIITPIFDPVTGTLAREVFWARKKAQTANECTVVYMGDSVCNQLWDEFDEDTDEICHIGCNQAITPVGSYLLLHEYLENHPQTKEVYYFVRPQTIANDIWIDFSYQYFVIPFCDVNNWALLDNETQEEIYNRFGEQFVDNQWLKTILLNNSLLMKCYLNRIQVQLEEHETHRISKAAAVYITKMRNLCDEYGINLHVKPNPLSDVDENYGWEKFEQDIKDYNLEDLLGGFIESIPYYPDNWFSDKMHFTKDILEKYGDDIRESVLS